MRALRILLVVTVALGAVLLVVDRVAVHVAEGEAADRLKATENLAHTPDVSIDGFPFLTQLADGTLDEVRVGIEDYEADTGDGARTIRIAGLSADLHDVDFSTDFSSAVAADATGTATIAYDELLEAAASEPGRAGPGVTARIVGLSDGGNGKIKVAVEATVLGVELPEPVSVLSSVTVVDGDTVRVKADAVPEFGGAEMVESGVRRITDFEQRIDGLPGGIRLDEVRATEAGVEITVKGSDVRLVG
ncbi:DUF2993 domain-containing protein [Streptomyces pimonensis]|uniref:DUF2993 domain-containing protein n=1 Tax=Streptomyces pimonensis TaxID=2860288 RepID=A0ABV4J5R4_9ACTN